MIEALDLSVVGTPRNHAAHTRLESASRPCAPPPCPRGSGSRSLAITAVLLAAACGQATRPNLVLVSIDTLRADHLGAYGYARNTSPFLDRLAAEGTLFETAMSTTSWTLPAHISMMTGVPDPVDGVVFDQRSLRPGIPLLAETLQDAGYHTIGFFTGPYLHPVFGFGRGFERYESCMSQDSFYDLPPPDPLASPFALQQRFQRKETEAHRDVTTDHVVRRVDGWLREDPPAPFFLFLHLFDVHHDYVPPPPFDTRFAGSPAGDVAGGERARRLARAAGVDPGELARTIALYDGEIAWVDQGLARIHAALTAHGHARDTIWIVTSDHGEEFYEHGKKGHRQDLEEEVLHVPLLFWGPGRVAAGRRVAGVVSLVDLAPTILDLAGIHREGFPASRSWAPRLLPGTERPEGAGAGGEAFASLYYLGDTAPRRRFWHALRTDRFSIVESGGLPFGEAGASARSGGGATGAGSTATGLPDLRRLEAESRRILVLAGPRAREPIDATTPLGAEARRRLRNLVERLQRARDALPAPAPSATPDLREIEERLHQLGYR